MHHVMFVRREGYLLLMVLLSWVVRGGLGFLAVLVGTAKHDFACGWVVQLLLESRVSGSESLEYLCEGLLSRQSSQGTNSR